MLTITQSFNAVSATCYNQRRLGIQGSIILFVDEHQPALQKNTNKARLPFSWCAGCDDATLRPASGFQLRVSVAILIAEQAKLKSGAGK